jgi:hypothetical protein
MKRIKRFNDTLITESVRILLPEEIEDFILDYVDTGQITVKSLDQNTIRDVRSNYKYFTNKKLVYKNSESSDKYLRDRVNYTDFDSSRTVSLLIEIPHPRRIKGNLDLHGYTFDTIKYVFRRFIEFTKGDYLVDIWIEILQTNMYYEPLSEVIVNITFPNKKLNEEIINNDWELDELSDLFELLEEYKNHEIPIEVKIFKLKEINNYKSFKIQIKHDFYDTHFIEKWIERQLPFIKSFGYIKYKTEVVKSGEYKRREIPVHGKDYKATVSDPILFSNIFVKKENKRLNENISIDKKEEVLLIVDIQKSFKKFFTENYIHQVKNYCKKFKEVYQIFDNHVDGKNVDKDYLYDDDHEVSVHDDLYWFPNQIDIIEKRYNYNVDVDFYKKILDRETYKKAKELESNKKLKIGDIFETKQGTHIVYVGNNHKWHHISKRLYDLFMKLKDKKVTIIGGADSECLSDIFTSAESLGVEIKRNWKYIYSASHCPL